MIELFCWALKSFIEPFFEDSKSKISIDVCIQESIQMFCPTYLFFLKSMDNYDSRADPLMKLALLWSKIVLRLLTDNGFVFIGTL